MKNKIGVILMTALVLCGCSATELEDRCFPMMAFIDEQDGQIAFSYGFPELSQKENTDMEEAKVDAPAVLGKSMKECVKKNSDEMEKLADCNHMKVLILGENLMQDSFRYDQTLAYLKETEIFPRNTYVCVTADPSRLLEIEKDLPEDLGSYLELFLQNHESDRQITLLNLGRLLDEQENQRLELKLPYLSVKNGTVVWEKNYVKGNYSSHLTNSYRQRINLNRTGK